MYEKMKREGVTVNLHLPRATHAYVDSCLWGDMLSLMDSIFLAYAKKHTNAVAEDVLISSQSLHAPLLSSY